MKKTFTNFFAASLLCAAAFALNTTSAGAQSVIFDLGPDTSYCGGPVTLVAGSGPNTYLWSTAETTASIVVTVTGTYMVSVTDSLSNITMDTVTITINANPVVAINGNSSMCSGDSVILTASGADMYSWLDGPVTAANTVMPTADSTFWVVGMDMLTMCYDSASFMVTVNMSPMTMQSVTVCEGDSVTVGSNTYYNSGVYYDTLSAMNGCDSTIMTTFTVDSGSVTTQMINGCTGYTITVGLNTYDSTGVYTDTLVSTFGCDSTVITNLTISNSSTATQNVTGCGIGYSLTVGSSVYTSTGTYIDTLMNMAGCDSVVTTNLTVTNIVNTTTTVSGFGYIITATNTNPGVTYQWMNCANGVPILGATNQSYYASANGVFACIITENGCSDTSICTGVANVGIIDPATVSTLSVYPNPTLNTVTITNSIPTEIVIYNTLGEVVRAEQIQTSTTIDVTSLDAGIYFIRTSEGEIVRLVKE